MKPDPSTDPTIAPSGASESVSWGPVGATADLPPEGPRSTRYVPKSFHARGGMGEVWLSQDSTIGRDVAMKTLRRDSQSAKLRFVAEAQITGQLEHPNIVPVHDFGIDEEGHPYYVMKFVRGRTFKRAIIDFHAQPELAKAASELEWSKLLQVFISLCHAMAYAHSRGVLHRDIKPDNVMLGTYGETLVLDWGIAKVIGQSESSYGSSGESSTDTGTGSVRTNVSTNSAETVEGTLLGTPSYMAPEMAEGRASEMDERTDVYLLGATLYEIITGQTPRQGNSREDLIELARSVHPLPARKLRASCPRALEAIALKAMAHQKEKRYATAMALAEEMQLYLAGEPVSACRESLPARAVRWCRRHRQILQHIAAGGLIAALVLFSVGTVAHLRKLQTLDRARANLIRFKQLADEAHYFAANTDSLSERVPYFDLAKGQVLAEQAISIAGKWGNHLENWPLLDDLPGFKSELYGLLLLDAQVRLARREDSKTTSSLLDDAIAINPVASHGYYRLRAEFDPTHAITKSSDLPLNADDLFLLGEHYRMQAADLDAAHSTGFIERALAAYQSAVKLQPDHYWSNFQIGRCYLSLGRQDQALASLTTCIALRPQEPWAYSARGLTLALLRRYGEAQSDLNAAINLQHEFAPAILNRGLCYWLQGDLPKALEDFEKALHPSNGEGLLEALFYRGQIHLSRDEYGQAADNFSQFLSARPSFPRARLLLAEAHALQGQADVCDGDLNSLLMTNKVVDSSDALMAAARGHLLRGLVADLPPIPSRVIAEQASLELQQSIHLGVQSGEVYADLAAVTEKIGGPAQAIPVYTQSIDIADNSETRLRRGCAYLMLRQIDKAEADFYRAVQISPGDTRAHFWLGYANALDGPNDIALYEAATTLTQGADSYVDLHNVACIFARFARADEAHRDEYLGLTVSLLKRAEAIWRTRPAAVSEIDAIRNEQDFQFSALQGRSDFQSLLSPAARLP